MDRNGRALMKGTNYKRKLPSGRTTWCLGIDDGKDENGKRKRIFKSGFRLEGDADNELTRLMQELNSRTPTSRPEDPGRVSRSVARRIRHAQGSAQDA